MDIGIELHDRIKAAFDARCARDSTLTHIKRKIEGGTAAMEDTSVYARRMGELLRKSIESTTKPDDLPDGKMYFNIAQSILEPLLRGNYDDVNAICAEVQSALDAKKGIGLKPQKADFPAERVRAAIGGAAVKETAEHAIQVLGRTAENITGSFQTDYIRKNAEFRSKAGLSCYIERKDGFRCCNWCAGLAGRYRYPDEVPKDVYRRHDNCTCDVSYVSEKGRQNVHTHQWNWDKEKNQEYLRQLDAEKKAKRAEYKANGKALQKVRFKPSESAARRERIERMEALPKPMKLTRAEAQAKQSEILAQRRLTYEAKRGIIQEREYRTAGLMFVSHRDDLYRFAVKVPAIENFEDVTLHADRDSFLILNPENSEIEERVTPRQLAQLLRNSKNYKNTNIRLLSCQAGYGGKKSLAQQLANELGVVIKAPTETLAIDNTGKTFISDNPLLLEMWENGENIQQTGEWVDFIPEVR